MISKKEQQLLLKLAREAIKTENSKLEPKELSKELKEKRAVFVTLTIDGELRGCIGHIEPVEPLYKSVINNAINAAYKDPRFPPLSKEEFPKTKIEISVLTKPEKLNYINADDLLKKIKPDMGLIIRKGFHSATFLPQVWEQLPKKEDFLQHLCLKAGLPGDVWKQGDLEVQVYKAEKFSE